MKISLLLAALLYTFPVLAEFKVLAISGSTRADSLNTKLLKEAAQVAVERGASVQVINLKEFPTPFYDADLEQSEGMPKEAKRLREMILSSQAVMIASPEYNGSISSVLKNALDWASRNEQAGPSREAFQGKKVVIMSVSPGAGGGARGLNHLRSIIQNIGGVVISTEVIVPNGSSAFNSQGKIQNPAVKQQLQKAVQELLSN